MPAITRLGDHCTGHDCWPPRPNNSASPNVYVNGIPLHRQGDSWASHCCGVACHPGITSAGSSTVYANGMQVCRIGDPVDCGSASAQGSWDVFAGG